MFGTTRLFFHNIIMHCLPVNWPVAHIWLSNKDFSDFREEEWIKGHKDPSEEKLLVPDSSNSLAQRDLQPFPFTLHQDSGEIYRNISSIKSAMSLILLLLLWFWTPPVLQNNHVVAGDSVNTLLRVYLSLLSRKRIKSRSGHRDVLHLELNFARSDSLIMWRDSWYLSSCFYAFNSPRKVFQTTVAGSSILPAGNEQGVMGQSILPTTEQRIVSRDLFCMRTLSRWYWNGIKHWSLLFFSQSDSQWKMFLMTPLAWLLFPAVFFFFFLDITIFHILWCHISSCLDHTAPAGASLSPSSSSSTVIHYQPYVRPYSSNILVGNVLTSTWRHRI